MLFLAACTWIPETELPGSPESCTDEAWYDGVDQDCNGRSDFDKDGDGFESSAYGGVDCWDDPDVLPAEYTSVGEDQPGAADVHPTAVETWYDGVDQDCVGDSDFDQDGDGYDLADECDDTDPARFPDASVAEVWYDAIDDNCDGNLADQDGDGHAADFAGGDDCWDDPTEVPAGYDAINGLPQPSADAVYPGAADVFYDGIDADCAGGDDFDADGDTYTTDALPDRAGALGEDCDDLEASIHPGAEDAWYDGIDADCIGNSDDDQDADGVDRAADCDDTDPAVSPSADEDCGTTADDNCDGSLNDVDAVGCAEFYADADATATAARTAGACAARTRRGAGRTTKTAMTPTAGSPQAPRRCATSTTSTKTATARPTMAMRARRA